jgi:hypothetical protein
MAATSVGGNAGVTAVRRTIKLCFDYYHGARAHLPLEEDAPETRVVQAPDLESVIELPEVGGLHHCYERRAA